MSRLPLGVEWSVPRGDCTHCHGSGRQWDGAGSREGCWGCRGTGSREVQVICEVYRRGYRAGIREVANSARREPMESFPTNVRLLLDAERTDA